MLAGNILLICAKTTSYTLNLDKYIQFTRSGIYSIDDFNAKIDDAALRQRPD